MGRAGASRWQRGQGQLATAYALACRSTSTGSLPSRANGSAAKAQACLDGNAGRGSSPLHTSSHAEALAREARPQVFVVKAVPVAYLSTGENVPEWLNKGDNAWQLIAATIVGLQSVPGLVILYGSMVKKKWAVNSAFMAFYALAAVLISWVTWASKMSFSERLLPFWGRPGPALAQSYLLQRASLPASEHFFSNGTTETAIATPFYPMATLVYFQFVFAAITLILLAGSSLGRMNFIASMLFVSLWLTFSYTIGAFSLWGGGFLFQWGIIDFAGGFVIHLSSGVAGLTAAYWEMMQVGPRMRKDRENFPPKNVLLTLTGAGLLWLGWSGFNGGAPYASNLSASMAVLNTHICAATSLLVWTGLDVCYFKKPSVIGAVQGMITGLVCITPGAGVVQCWVAMAMGVCSGSVPWFTMMVVHKRSAFLQKLMTHWECSTHMQLPDS
ncbi:hypothetical protein L7F22_054957 [Adiantum nelumboides]|nr:hypothetical protein [Adiantum nelumboides]